MNNKNEIVVTDFHNHSVKVGIQSYSKIEHDDPTLNLNSVLLVSMATYGARLETPESAVYRSLKKTV